MKLVKILLVDDDPMLLRAHQRLISSLECANAIDVHTASGVVEGFAAVSLAQAFNVPYQMVISDVDMLDGTGFDLVRMVRDKYTGGEAPHILLVTGYADDDKRERAANMRINLVEKSYFSTDVLPSIKSLVKMQAM